MNQDRAEFDSYAEEYTAGMEDPVKRLIGGSSDTFFRVKARWLLMDLARYPLDSIPFPEAVRLLEFGCGTGELLQALRKQGFEGKLEGCDISKGMLTEATKRWNDGPTPLLYLIDKGGDTGLEGFYDLVTACCVFHHISQSERSGVFNELARILKPAGRLVVFEHNPLNPVTRWVVGRAPIDRNAVLLRASKIREAMASAGLTGIRVDYFLFFPPRFRWLEWAERILSRLPFGGQYVVVGEKPLPCVEVAPG